MSILVYQDCPVVHFLGDIQYSDLTQLCQIAVHTISTQCAILTSFFPTTKKKNMSFTCSLLFCHFLCPDTCCDGRSGDNLSRASPAAPTSPISPTSSTQLYLTQSHWQLFLFWWGKQSWVNSWCPRTLQPLHLDILAHQPKLLCYSHTRENSSWGPSYYDCVQLTCGPVALEKVTPVATKTQSRFKATLVLQDSNKTAVRVNLVPVWVGSSWQFHAICLW